MKIVTYVGRVAAVGVMVLATGCGGKAASQKSTDFFTSGDREADQRADQRMAKSEQLKGQGQTKKVGGKDDPQVNEKPSLYERLGGEQGLTAITDDFIARALADPRVNWERKGVKQGGFSLSRGKSVEWDASKANVAQLKKHIVQFLSLATGGP